MKFNNKFFLEVFFGLAINTLFVSVCLAEEEKVLNIYNWVDYIAPDTIANFEKETGIKVRYDIYEDNETLDDILRSKKVIFDVVVPSSDWVKGQIDSGLLLKLDKSQLGNTANLSVDIAEQMKKTGLNNDYLVGYLWGYTTIGVNVKKVVDALGKTPMPNNIWDLVFNPQYTSKLKSCGITFLDSTSDIIPLALNYLGKPAYSETPSDYKAVLQVLKKVRPDIKEFTSVGQAEKLVDKSTCIAIGWGGDFYRARALSQANKDGSNIAPVIPEQGALLFMDSMAIPKNAKHLRNAHLFINYILRPEVHAEITNATKYANPNKASLKFVAHKIVNDRSLFLDQNAFGRLIAPKSVDAYIKKIRQETFDSFKAGT